VGRLDLQRFTGGAVEPRSFDGDRWQEYRRGARHLSGAGVQNAVKLRCVKNGRPVLSENAPSL